MDQMPKIPTSVTIIAKDCAESLRACLESLVANYLRDDDEIIVLDTGSSDNTVEVAREFGATVLERPDLTQNESRELCAKWLPDHIEALDAHPQLKNGFLLDFAGAREIVTRAAKHDVIFWIDADDVLEEDQPGALREAVDRVFPAYKGLFLDYHYDHTKDDGTLATILKRERIVDRRQFRWVGKCHEVLIPHENDDNSTFFTDLRSRIVHQPAHRKDHIIGDIRNYTIIRKEITEAQEVDPRSIYYLGNAAWGLKRWKEAHGLYKRFMTQTGSRDDMYNAAYHIANSYLHDSVRRPTTAQQWFFQCIRYKPEDPRGYFGLARCAYLLERFAESLHWFKIGSQLPPPSLNTHAFNPHDLNTEPLKVAVLAAKNLGERDLALGFLEDLARARPRDPEVADLVKFIQRWVAGEKLTEAVESVAVNSKSVKDPENQRSVVNGIRAVATQLREVPEKLEKLGLGAIEVNPCCPVAFFCGGTVEAWGPQSVEAGIGGSEKMTIYLSRLLTKLGKPCVVYANVPQEQRGMDADGVLWRHFSEFDPTIQRDTVIFWRSPQNAMLQAPIRRRVLWCHDVQRPRDYTDAVIEVLDQVVVLTEFHANTLGPARAKLETAGKLVISRNGIDPEIYQPIAEGARDPLKCIFASSPERGVLTAIRQFQAIRELRPEATLDIFYGFTPTAIKRFAGYEYGYVPDQKCARHFYDYMEEVLTTIDNTPGVRLLNRVGFSKIAEAQKTAGIWLYPTTFDEISCMAAMEAQAAGCLVVATKHSALAETIDPKHPSIIVPTDRLFVDPQLIIDKSLALREETRRYHAERAIRRFSVEPLAKEWLYNIV